MLVEMLFNTFSTLLVLKNGVFLLFREVDIIVMSITKNVFQHSDNSLYTLLVLYNQGTMAEGCVSIYQMVSGWIVSNNGTQY